jgi:hypothetical protein
MYVCLIARLNDVGQVRLKCEVGALKLLVNMTVTGALFNSYRILQSRAINN